MWHFVAAGQPSPAWMAQPMLPRSPLTRLQHLADEGQVVGTQLLHHGDQHGAGRVAGQGEGAEG